MQKSTHIIDCRGQDLHITRLAAPGRHRLTQHGLDPDLVDAIKREKDAKIHEDYIRRFGPRPEEAKRQANSSPFF